MLSNHRIFNILYFLIVIFNIYALATENNLLRTIAVPLIGIALTLYLILKTKLEETFHKLVFGGIIMSMAGDIQLLFTTGAEFYLLTALIATLLAYSLYSIAYYIDFSHDFKATKQVGNRVFLLLIISTSTLYFSASPNLGEFRYPTIAYLLVLTIMVVLAGYRHKRVNRLSFKLIFTGSISFLISDLSIGYYNFIDQDSVMMLLFISTYLIAQYLVVIGTIHRRSI